MADERAAPATADIAILNALPAHVAVLDARGTIVAVNDAWRRLAEEDGLVREAADVGADYLDACERAHVAFADKGPLIAKGVRSVLLGECAEFSFEYLSHSPARERWFRVMASPLDTGRRAGVVVLHVDITERKLAEAKLRESERKQRKLALQLRSERARLVEAQAVARIGSWETDLITQAVSWSPETFRIFDVDPSTFSPTHPRFLELVHPDDRAAVDTAFKESLADRAVHAIEHRILLPQGRIRRVEERWQVFEGADGLAERAVGTCEDVTERHGTEAALQANQALLRMASRVSRLGAWSVELGLGRVTWSDEIRRIYEVALDFEPSLEEALAFCAPEDLQRAREVFEACAREGAPFDEELEIVSAQGRRIPVRAVGEAVRGLGGTIVRVQGSLQELAPRQGAPAPRR